MRIDPIPLLLLALLLSVGCPAAAGEWRWTAEERAYLDAKGTIRLCAAPDWPPMESLDTQGRHVGIAADVFALFAERAGLRFEVLKVDAWDEAVALSRGYACDVLTMAMDSPERREWLDFTTPYLVIPSVVATRSDAPYVTSIEALLHQPLGHMRGFAGIGLLRAAYPQIRLVEVDSYAEGLARVQAGELYGMIGNMASISRALQDARIGDLKIAGWVGRDSHMSIGTRKDEPELGRIMQRLVDSLTPAEIQAILNRWLTVRFEQGFDYALFWRSLVVFLLLVGAALIWAFSLRRLNARLHQANARLAEASQRDGLTGLHNRSYFEARLAAALRSCARRRLRLSLAMIDLDHFKRVNDSHGHLAGDEALRQVARLLERRFRRESDATARYGGEEFVLLVEGDELEEVAAQLEALREEIASTPCRVDETSLPLSISIGLHSTVPEPDADLRETIRAADAALYRAKAAGRNRLALSPTSTSGQGEVAGTGDVIREPSRTS
jgi:polar amino acid transport system substrate-binding protein